MRHKLKIILRVTEIPVTIRLVGDPVSLASQILGVKKTSDDKEPSINKSILIGKNAECRLKDYCIRQELKAPQDLLLSFGILEESSLYEISEFLFNSLADKKGLTLIVGKEEVPINKEDIIKTLEKNFHQNQQL